MKRFYFAGLVILIAILSGINSRVSAQTTTFNYTGSVQTYTVPACVSNIVIDAQGAMGGHSPNSHGGYGGRVQCTMSVTPGDVLDVYVGGHGDTALPTAGGMGGYNGGDSGSYAYSSGGSYYSGGGGGGASDVRVSPYGLSDRVVAAGGGGGGSIDCAGADLNVGGAGGGLTGENGHNCGSATNGKGGGGGTPTSGGNGGVYISWKSGNPGAFGNGGDCDSSGGGVNMSAGGGGGGGWYGGGGGSFGGGGGGSSYTNPTRVTGVVHTQGYNTAGDGVVSITPGCDQIGTIAGSSFTVCIGDTMELSDPVTALCSSWSSSSTAVATIGSASGVVTGVTAGTTMITYNVPNPCGGTSAVQAITVANCVTGVGQTITANRYNVDVFPNPAQNELTIRTDGRTYTSMTITNDIGQVVAQQQITGTKTTVNLKELPSAIYYITLRGSATTTVKRFVKMD